MIHWCTGGLLVFQKVSTYKTFGSQQNKTLIRFNFKYCLRKNVMLFKSIEGSALPQLLWAWITQHISVDSQWVTNNPNKKLHHLFCQMMSRHFSLEHESCLLWNGDIIWSGDIILWRMGCHGKIHILKHPSIYERDFPTSLFLSCCPKQTHLKKTQNNYFYSLYNFILPDYLFFRQ